MPILEANKRIGVTLQNVRVRVGLVRQFRVNLVVGCKFRGNFMQAELKASGDSSFNRMCIIPPTLHRPKLSRSN